MTRDEKAELFRALHIPGDPLVLFNIWDAGSARAVAATGAKAVATGSWSVAAAHGYEDGEALPLDLVIANVARIIAAVDVPVTIDLERGYGDVPEEVSASAARAAEAGAVGCNLEDSNREGGLVEPEEQCRRIAAVRAGAGATFFINARIDCFLQAPTIGHERLMEGALERAAAYREAGADGIFVPGLAAERLIGRFCEACRLPVNILEGRRVADAKRLGALGVARISHGSLPYRNMLDRLQGEAQAIYA
jgi:2-methylisocitrate lyase-like PEP mutase family enzyme